jgi:hypothetical protein
MILQLLVSDLVKSFSLRSDLNIDRVVEVFSGAFKALNFEEVCAVEF